MITDLLTIDMDKEPLKFEDWKFINSQRKIEVREVYKTILKTVVRILKKQDLNPFKVQLWIYQCMH